MRILCTTAALPCSVIFVTAGEAFTETDQRYLQADSGGNRDDGCTAVTAVIVGNTVVVAHVGDSRAVLAKTGKGERLPPDLTEHLELFSRIAAMSQAKVASAVNWICFISLPSVSGCQRSAACMAASWGEHMNFVTALLRVMQDPDTQALTEAAPAWPTVTGKLC